ncbi:hypothetical protein SmJEL517_g02729 [Synchytrium microbalum]|uniref:Uncharacterized protein n=1 Tax=Synchytrium microbalum TaxID=1806994 RepID=A0A507CAV3_9FUNG|nr:uncharacterized protein SmJEL517_g02729 [Synchytrium microbalum]TPX34655.1 hypothetical protein SmJEL517_g02729 [Synchytrium microbalum]
MDIEDIRTLRKEFSELPSDLIYVAISGAFVGLNQTPAFPVLVKCILNDHKPEAAAMLTLCRETVIYGHLFNVESLLNTVTPKTQIYKTLAVAGAPRVINGLTQLANGIKAVDPSITLATLQSRPKEQFLDWRPRGEAFFDIVYDKNTHRVKSILNSIHPDLLDAILTEQYGRVLSDVSTLNAIYTELGMVACLRSQGGEVMKQSESHRRGALYVGATIQQVENVEKITDIIVSKFGKGKL